MNIQDIAKSKEKKAVFEMVLEEACRQWCDCIDEAPERKDGEGFSEVRSGHPVYQYGRFGPVPSPAWYFHAS